MSDYTTNLSLSKPATNAQDWRDEVNDNMDILDEVIGKIEFTDGSSSAGELEAGDCAYINSDGEADLADATDDTKPCSAICSSTDGIDTKLKNFGFALVNTVGDGDIVINDIVYLSTTPGKVTKTEPDESGNIVQEIGRAVSDEESDGQIYVSLQIGLTLA